MEQLNQEKEKFFDILLNAIIAIYDLNGEKITYSTLNIKYVKSKKSKVYSWILFIDDIPCTSYKRNYKVTYKCRCGSINTILLQKFLYKTKLSCNNCSQLKKFGGIGNNNPNRPKIIQHKTIKNFNDESEQFKTSYFQNHLTINEFQLWLPKIIQINDIILNKEIRDKIQYLPHELCNNQFKYTDMILINNQKISIKTIYLKCDICGKIHKVHTNNIKNKNINYIKCTQCALTNHTFPIQKYKNTNLTYQSSIEKKFLDICFKYNIIVENGLIIPYEWENKIHNYNTDFYLPTYKTIIELKSNNIFYRQQKESGKIDAKNSAAIQYANLHNMLFRFLFDNEIEHFLNTLLTNEIV